MLTTKQQKFNSVLVQADSNDELAQTFMRFQEHYESPKFKNQIFTIGQLKQWYSETYGADTYVGDWEGFNFPSHILLPFRQGLFDPLTSYEQNLLDLFKYRHDSFYIIGANDTSTIRHELSHSLYAYNSSYRNKVNNICKLYSKALEPIKNYLLEKGYHYEVLNDEIQAYITDNSDKFIMSNLDTNILNKYNKLYENFSRESSL
jgi:hypothetical protein